METLNIASGTLATFIVALLEDDDTSSSSESDSSNDDPWEDVMFASLLYHHNEESPDPKILDYVERVVPGYSRWTFKEHFRMFPETFDVLLQEVKPFIVKGENKGGLPPMPASKQLLLCLWFMANPDSYRSVSTQFGVNKGTAHRVVKRVCRALVRLAPTVIQWPKGNNAVDACQQFQRLKGFPGVIGAIDGSHIPIRAPKEDPNSYFNRKSYHSIILRAVCNARCEFIHCCCGAPGSVHDARVFRNSAIANRLGNLQYFPSNTHLLGDGGYTLHTNLLVPFRDNGHLTQQQRNFNYLLSATRVCIERAFGLMKVRFRILLDCLPLTDLKFIPNFVMACCVLHNICMSQNDVFPLLERRNEEEAPHRGGEALEDGIAKRNRIMNELPMRRRLQE